MALELRRRRFTAEEYHQMARAGILGEDDRVELIDGEIVEMTPIGHRHALCVNRLTRWFSRALCDAAVVSVQNPVRLGEYSEPQPDLAILRPPDDLYADRHPLPGDALLLVEVAATSADPDRRTKIPLYARAGVVEVWLIDLEQGTITAYTDPTPDGYRNARVLHRGEQVAPNAFPDQSLPVAEVLPE